MIVAIPETASYSNAFIFFSSPLLLPNAVTVVIPFTGVPSRNPTVLGVKNPVPPSTIVKFVTIPASALFTTPPPTY